MNKTSVYQLQFIVAQYVHGLKENLVGSGSCLRTTIDVLSVKPSS